MKRYISIIILLVASLFNSQNIGVGINTQYPKGIFHIDGAKDNNNSPTVSMAENDMLLTADGKLGIGILAPQNKLHIHTSSFGNGFRLADGTQSSGYLLKCLDSNGNVAWSPRLTTIIISNDNSGSYNGNVNSNLQYIYRKVTLTPGKWLIRTNLLLYANNDGSLSKGFYAKFSWAEYNGTNYIVSPDAVYGNIIGGSYILQYGIAIGTTLINNASSTAKTYYLVTRTPDFWGAYNTGSTWHSIGGEWAENSIIAYSAN